MIVASAAVQAPPACVIEKSDHHREWVVRVVEKYEQPLIVYAQRLTRDADRARDVVQETFVRLCKQDRGAIDDHLAEWLYRVCRTRALDIQRKEQRLTPLSDEQAEHQRSHEQAPHESAETSEHFALALRIISGLSENQQEVLRLKFQHGLSYKEISEVTKLSVANVGFLIHCGLKALREKMNPDAEGRAGLCARQDEMEGGA